MILKQQWQCVGMGGILDRILVCYAPNNLSLLPSGQRRCVTGCMNRCAKPETEDKKNDDIEKGKIDLDEVKKLAKENKPKLSPPPQNSDS